MLRQGPEGREGALLSSEVISTGVEGLDEILRGGLPGRLPYLVEGSCGAGKTTLALQFARRGVEAGEKVVYISLVEPPEELARVARSHGWDLEGIELQYMGGHVAQERQTLLHPADVELPRLIDAIHEVIEGRCPARIVIDSLTELRLAAGEGRLFRRELHRLCRRLAETSCPSLLLDSQAPGPRDAYIDSLVSGIVLLERIATDFGSVRRRVSLPKMRGLSYDDAYHDLRIVTGGMEVYPRLAPGAAAASRAGAAPEAMELASTGLESLDRMLGGGLNRGTSTMFIGPAGVGKSVLVTQCVAAAAKRGEASALYLFDERPMTFMSRARSMGLGVEAGLESGLIGLQHVDPAELTPGEFSWRVRQEVEQRGVKFLVIDSLSGYLSAMPDERDLTLYLHELLTYLGGRGVSSLMVLAQHGMIRADTRPPMDISYLADTVALLRFFEVRGEVGQAISIHKRRTGGHERHARELRITACGPVVGEPLRDFEDVLSGAPWFVGRSPDSAAGARDGA